MKHLKDIKINETTFYANFDFEDFIDTDLAGSSMEIMIDRLIEEAKERINETIPNTPDNNRLKIQARIAIKKLWKSKIDGWR